MCESGTAVFVFNLQTRTKTQPCMHTVCMFRRHTDLWFNAHFKDQLLQTLAPICAKESCMTSTENLVVDFKKKHCNEAEHREERKP